MSAEFSIDYDLVMQAANTFEVASGQFKEIVDTMEYLRSQLTSTWLVGLTGNAASQNLEGLQARLNQHIAKVDEMRGDLLATVGDVRDDIDPDMAGRFQD